MNYKEFQTSNTCCTTFKNFRFILEIIQSHVGVIVYCRYFNGKLTENILPMYSIVEIQNEDAGEYSCSPENGISEGMVPSNITVEVLCKCKMFNL